MVLKVNRLEKIHSDAQNINNYSGQSYLLSGLATTENTPNDMDVLVSAGEFVLNGAKVSCAGGNVTLTAASAGLYKYVIIRANSSGVLSAVEDLSLEDNTDDSVGSPALGVPDYDPDNYVAIARVLVGDVTAIVNANIKDLRRIDLRTNDEILKIMARLNIDISVDDIVDYDLPSGTDTLTKELYIYKNFNVASGATLNLTDKPTTIVVTGDLNVAGTINIGDYDGSTSYIYSATNGEIGNQGTYGWVGGAGGSAQTKLSLVPYKHELLKNLYNFDFSGTFANGLSGAGGDGDDGTGGAGGLPKNQIIFVVLGDSEISGNINGEGNIGGNGSGLTGGGGAGGSGASIIFECWQNFTINSGEINVSGGNGGNGRNGNSSNKSGSGGGAGGSGGLIAIIYKNTITEISQTYNISGGTGGIGGTFYTSTGGNMDTGGGGGSGGSFSDGVKGGDSSNVTSTDAENGEDGNEGKLIILQI